jgi:hypothetical protein
MSISASLPGYRGGEDGYTCLGNCLVDGTGWHLAGRDVTQPADVAGIPAVNGQSAEQLLDHRLQLSLFRRRQRGKHLVKELEPLLCCRQRCPLAGNGQNKRPGSRVILARPALDQAVSLKPIDQANRGWMRDVQQPGQKVDVLPRSQTEMGQGGRRRQAAAVVVGPHFLQAVDNGDGKRAEEVRLTGDAVRSMHALGIYPVTPDGKRVSEAVARAFAVGMVFEGNAYA